MSVVGSVTPRPAVWLVLPMGSDGVLDRLAEDLLSVRGLLPPPPPPARFTGVVDTQGDVVVPSSTGTFCELVFQIIKT